MITLEQACEIVSKENGTRYIGAVKELENMYIIYILSNEGQEQLDSGRFVDKRTGEYGVYHILMMAQTFRELKPLEVPEQYRYHGEIK